MSRPVDCAASCIFPYYNGLSSTAVRPFSHGVNLAPIASRSTRVNYWFFGSRKILYVRPSAQWLSLIPELSLEDYVLEITSPFSTGNGYEALTWSYLLGTWSHICFSIRVVADRPYETDKWCMKIGNGGRRLTPVLHERGPYDDVIGQFLVVEKPQRRLPENSSPTWSAYDASLCLWGCSGVDGVKYVEWWGWYICTYVPDPRTGGVFMFSCWNRSLCVTGG